MVKDLKFKGNIYVSPFYRTIETASFTGKLLDQKLILEIAKVIREGYLQQNAFHKDDTFVSLEKQLLMMKTILHLYERTKHLVSANIPIARVLEKGLFDKLLKMKYDIPNDKLEMFDDYIKDIDQKIEEITAVQL